jgi:hypothetical protein
MHRIVFQYTPRSIYSAQGSGPSMMEGYDVWLYDEEDSLYNWLEYCTLEEKDRLVSRYRGQGETVYMRSSNE